MLFFFVSIMYQENISSSLLRISVLRGAFVCVLKTISSGELLNVGDEAFVASPFLYKPKTNA